MSDMSQANEPRHWAGKPEYTVPCDAMGTDGRCSMCEELEALRAQEDGEAFAAEQAKLEAWQRMSDRERENSIKEAM